MMRGKKNEIEELDSGLSLAKDPYKLADLLTQSKEDLAVHIHARVRYTALDMADQGRYFHAIKKLCGHTHWESFVNEQKWSWEYVRCCMKLIEVAAWLPQILNVPPGRLLQGLMHVPKPEIKKLLAELSPEEASKLTVWDLKRLHGKIPKKPLKPIPADVMERANRRVLNRDKFQKELDKAFTAALTALGKLASIKIDPSWYDDIFESEMTQKLGEIYGRAIANLHPIEEIMKRAEIIHAPGFGDPL